MLCDLLHVLRARILLATVLGRASLVIDPSSVSYYPFFINRLPYGLDSFVVISILNKLAESQIGN